MSEQTRGHLIVRTAPTAFRAALARAAGVVERRGYETYVRGLWSALSMPAPSRYRGIDRDPLEPLFETGVQTVAGVGPDWVAKVRMREGVRAGSQDPSYWSRLDPDVIEDPGFAREVAGLTDRPADWEVIEVDRAERLVGDATLGFDVGCWGSDHFSIVHDSMLVPSRHGPPSEEFGALRPFAKRLNEHALFAQWSDADAFRSWYRDRPWAERESEEDDPEFHVVRVASVPEAPPRA